MSTLGVCLNIVLILVIGYGSIRCYISSISFDLDKWKKERPPSSDLDFLILAHCILLLRYRLQMIKSDNQCKAADEVEFNQNWLNLCNWYLQTWNTHVNTEKN